MRMRIKYIFLIINQHYRLKLKSLGQPGLLAVVQRQIELRIIHIGNVAGGKVSRKDKVDRAMYLVSQWGTHLAEF